MPSEKLLYCDVKQSSPLLRSLLDQQCFHWGRLRNQGSHECRLHRGRHDGKNVTDYRGRLCVLFSSHYVDTFLNIARHENPENAHVHHHASPTGADDAHDDGGDLRDDCRLPDCGGGVLCLRLY